MRTSLAAEEISSGLSLSCGNPNPPDYRRYHGLLCGCDVKKHSILVLNVAGQPI